MCSTLDHRKLCQKVQITVCTCNIIHFQVFFIDYGNEDSNMPIKHIFEIGPNIADLKCLDIVPPFALECTLAGIGPSTLKNKNGIWSNHATQMFQKLIQRARLQGEVST